MALVMHCRWSLSIVGRFGMVCYYFLGWEGLSLLVWRVGGVSDSSVHLKVFSGFPGSLSLSFCLVGGDGDWRVDWESFDPVPEGSPLMF